jgi:hypothetical protein
MFRCRFLDRRFLDDTPAAAPFSKPARESEIQRRAA